MADVFYLQAVDANGNKGEVCTYSVMEYMLERLYGGYELSEKQRTVYEKALEFGAAAQDLLTTGETLVTDYRYVKGGEGVLVNGKSVVIAKAGEELNLTYEGGTVATWNVYDNTGGLVGNISAKNTVVAEGHYTYEADTSFRGTGLYADHPSALGFDGVTATELGAAGVLINHTAHTPTSLDGTTNYAKVSASALSFIKNNTSASTLTFNAAALGTVNVLELDFMLDPDADFSESRGSDNMLFQLLGSNGTANYVWTFPRVDMNLIDVEGTLRPAVNAFGVTDYVLEKGVWYNLRIELNGVDTGSTYTAYFNGQKVSADGAAITGSISTVNAIAVYGCPNTKFGIHFDNFFFGDPNRGAGLYKDKSEQFNNMSAVPGTSEEYGTIVKTKGFDLNTLTVESGVNDKVLKVYRANSSNGILKEDRFNIVRQGTANNMVFEADFNLSELYQGASRNFVIGATSSETGTHSIWGNHSINIGWNADLGKNVLTVGGVTYEFTEGEWFNLRVEYESLAEGGKINVYVNGELIGTGALTKAIGGTIAFNCYALGSGGTPWGRGINGTIQMDNIYLGDK